MVFQASFESTETKTLHCLKNQLEIKEQEIFNFRHISIRSSFTTTASHSILEFGEPAERFWSRRVPTTAPWEGSTCHSATHRREHQAESRPWQVLFSFSSNTFFYFSILLFTLFLTPLYRMERDALKKELETKNQEVQEKEQSIMQSRMIVFHKTSMIRFK